KRARLRRSCRSVSRARGDNAIMPRKIPGFSAFIPDDVKLSNGDFAEIERLAGVAFDRAQRGQINGALTEYVEDIAVYRAAPRAGAVDRSLSAIEKTAKTFADALSALRGAEPQAQAALSSLRSQPPNLHRADVARLTSDAYAMAARAAGARA